MSMDSAAECLLRNKEQILASWLEKVKRHVSSARKTPDPVLIDTLPLFMDNLVKALSPDDVHHTANSFNTVAQEHGGERARLSFYYAEDIIKEYQLLRSVVMETLVQNNALSRDSTLVIVTSFDEAINEALTAFFLVHTGLREQVAATLTHDLRTPLGSILGLAQLLKRSANDPAKTKDFAERIERNANRMNVMLEGLLDASKMRAGDALVLDFQECDLLEIARDVLTEMNLFHQARFQLEGESVVGFWNADSIRRALENLCSNAVKYGYADRPVQVQVKETLGRAMLSVHNEGPVIPIENREMLFQAFRRAESLAEGQKGWGLGLAYVRGAAEAHGGSVGIESIEGEGTTFTIDILRDPRIIKNRLLTPGT